MHTPLLRRLSGLALPLLALLLTLGIQRASATHLLGGELTYRYLDANGRGTVSVNGVIVSAPFRYEVTLGVYTNADTSGVRCNPGSSTVPFGCNPNYSLVPKGRPQVTIAFYLKDGTQIGPFQGYTFNKTSGALATPRPPNCPNVTPPSPVWLSTYTRIIELPLAFDGYYAFWSDAARNNDIANIVANGPGGGTGNMTLFSDMAPPTTPNSSPTFADTAVAVICRGDTTLIINNAVDADGDRLTYSFGTPFAGSYGQGGPMGGLPNPPASFVPNPPSIAYRAGFSAGQPFGTAAGNLASLNANTGLSRYSAQSTGAYVVAVDVNEFRLINGVEQLVGRTRRDIQLVVRACPAGGNPSLPALGVLPRTYTVEEGQPLTFPIQATTNPNNIAVNVRVSSALLDGAGGRYDATYNGSAGVVAGATGAVTTTGVGAAGGNFQFNTRCGDARTNPYDVLVTATNQDCKRKTIADVFQITVRRTPAPTAITGDNVVCNPGVARTYSAQGPTPPQGYRWRVSGGTITAGQGTAAVTVLWASTSGPRFVSLKNVSAFGCFSDSVSRAVDVRPVGTLTATAAAPVLCRGVGTTLSVTSATAGLSYAWTAGPGTPALTGATVSVTPTQTTTYTVTGTTADGLCNTTATVTVTVSPPPVANAGASRRICAGTTTQLGGPPVAGLAYAWTPTTGLDNPASAQPTFSGAATTTFTLTVGSGPGCAPSTATVTVTVNPAPTPDAGANRAVCSGTATTLGTPGVAGTTYAWTPATGLDNPTLAQPTLTAGTVPGTVRYLVTASLPNAAGAPCTATDSVFVTVNARPALLTIQPQTLCAGGTVSLAGDTSQPIGLTYQWSPTTGLALPTSAVTNLTLTTPGTFTYTLTATVTATGCTSTTTAQITVNPQPAAVAGPDRQFCSGGSATLGGAAVAGLRYAWTPAIGLSSATVANPTVTGTNATLNVRIPTRYVLTTTTALGCTATDTVLVTIDPTPGGVAGLPQSLCSGNTVTLGGGIPVPGATFAWTPTTGLSDPTVLQPTLTLTNATGAAVTTVYSLTVTNPASLGGCTATSGAAITVFPAVVANPGAALAFCSGETRQLAAGSAPAANTAYAWTPTTGLSDPTILNPTISLTNTTGAVQTFAYTLRATTAFPNASCSNTASVNVTVNPAAVALPGPAVTFCSGNSQQLGSTAAPLPGIAYAWTPTTGLSNPSVLNPTVTGTNATSAPITTTYTLTVTNPASLGSCVASATTTVTINPRGVAALPVPAFTVCSRQPQAIGRASSASTSYQWTATPAQYLANLSSATVANPTATLTNNGPAPFTVVYQLRATSTFLGASCPDSATVRVTVNPKGRPTTGPALVFCSGETRRLGDVPTASTSYVWTASAPAALAGLSSATAANPTLTLTNTTAAPLVYDYTLTATTTFAGASCDSAATVRVTVNPAAVAQAGPDRATCSGVGVGIGVGPAVAGTAYAWTPTTGLDNPASLTPLATLLNLGTAPVVQQYVLLATTANGCFRRDTVNVTINPAAVAQATPATGAPVFCSGKSAQLGGNGPAVGGSTYAWTPTTGLSNAAVFNPTVTGTNPTAAPLVVRYRLRVTTALGCVDSAFVNVTINPAAVADAGAAPAPICSGGRATLGTGPAVAGATYQWSPTTGLATPTAPTTAVTLTNATSAVTTTRFRLLVTTALGCVDSAFVTVRVNPAAVANAGRDTTLCALKRTTLGTPALPGYTYAWTPATGLSSVAAAQPILSTTNLTNAPVTTTYFVTATTPLGCSARDSVLVTVNPRPAADSIVGPASVCPTTPGLAYSIRNPRATAYQWLVSGGTLASGQGTPAITVDWGAAGTGFVKAFTLNALGCSSDTVTLPIRINTRLQTATPTGPGDVTARAPLPRAVCQADGPYTYSTILANGSVYSWTIIGGTQTGTNLASVTVSWNPVTVPTIGRIVVTETSNPASGVRCLGGSDTLRVLINPSPLPTLAITGPAAVCQGSGPVTFGLPGGFAGSTYAFTFGGAALASTGPTATLATLPTPGTYVVTARETTSAGCAGPALTFDFTVNPTAAPALISGPRFVCDFASPLTYSVPATPGGTYAWTATNGTITAGQGTSQVSVQFVPGAASYAVGVTPSTAFGCAGAAATQAVLFDNPGIRLAVASVAVANNTSIVLTLAAPNSGNTPNAIQVLRRVAGSGAAFAVVGTVPAAATTYTDANGVDATANSYEYQLSLTNGCGITSLATLTQTVRLVATAAPGTGGRSQGSTALAWNAYVGFVVSEYRILRANDGGPETLVATAPAAARTATVPNGEANSAQGAGFAQNFRVVAVGPAGLVSNSNTANAAFANPIVTYNVITPNNDGFNDVLVIDNIGLYPGNEFTVFNRWGREVYRTTNYRNNWGGDANTAPGNYYFLLKTADGTSRKGWFEVIK